MPFLNSVEVEVLRLLMGSSGYLSEAEISRVLGISRGDVVGALERLVSLGYRIEAVPGRGFRFISVDDLSTVGERLAGLGTRLGFAVHYLEECSSTQDVAESLVLRGAPEGTVVIAGRLASGRGRMGRRWYAPEGGIWMTLVLRPKSVRVLQLMSLAMGVAVAEAIRSVLDVDARVKWPNDVLVEEKKVAGILIECRVEAGSVHHVLVGIGINVNNEIPEDLRDTAISLREAVGVPIPRPAILGELLKNIDRVYGMLVEGMHRSVVEMWKRVSSTIGRMVRVVTPDGELVGTAVDIGDDGSLIVVDGGGVLHTISVGDVLHLRYPPAPWGKA